MVHSLLRNAIPESAQELNFAIHIWDNAGIT